MTLNVYRSRIVPKRDRAPLALVTERVRIVLGLPRQSWCEWPEGSKRTRCGRLVLDTWKPVKLGAVTCDWCKAKAGR